MRRLILFIVTFLAVVTARAQVGEYRNELAVGGSAGVTMTSVNFLPKVPQGLLMGKTVGLTLRYTGEKYFNSICAVVAEVNLAETGWKESILDLNDQPVMRLDSRFPSLPGWGGDVSAAASSSSSR